MEQTGESLMNDYDLVICGAGLAGLTLARQITKEIPGMSLIVIEGTADKSRTGAIQVGESTIEISANYLANVVGLRDYLEASHYHKWGFRFFFGSGDTPLQQRPEIGTTHASPLNSYQIDRALLEKDVKRLNAEMGIQMLSESKVEDIELADDNGFHTITLRQKASDQRCTVRCRWVIDAMGRRRFLQKKLGIAEAHNRLHSAAWFRLKGRIDVCDLVPRSESEWHGRVPDNNRYYSTNHLMEHGRWVWLIPLASGHTSIGIVAREDFFPFEGYNTYERALQWLRTYEPLLWNRIKDLEPVDFQCLRHYSYNAKQVFSLQRWACTGDAAIFADPFLSPGIDQIGFANTLITEMIKRDQRQALDARTVNQFNGTFLSFHSATVWITQPAYAFYGNALVAGAKMIWDIVRGFSLNAPARLNNIYLDDQKTSILQPILSQTFLLTLRMEKLFRSWADRSSGMNTYKFIDYFAVPGMLELYRRNLQANKTVEELVTNHQRTFEYVEELAQIILVLALADTMPEMLSQLPSPLWLNVGGIGLDPKRWETDKLFTPTSQPRPLQIEKFASLFGMPELPSLLSGFSDKVAP